MDRKELKELLPIMHAYVDGRIIQFKKKEDNDWIDLLEGGIVISPGYDYRIKPEPKYRPFKTQEECWQEMLKHEPFGWVVAKNTDAYVHIRSVCGEYAGQPPMVVFEYGNSYFTFEQIFSIYNFADGTPFGIKEE